MKLDIIIVMIFIAISITGSTLLIQHGFESDSKPCLLVDIGVPH